MKLVKTLLAKPAVQAALCRPIAGYLRLVYRTGRWTLIGIDKPAPYLESGKAVIGCFWHGRMLMMPYAWQWEGPFAMLISRHRDGRLISSTVGHLGITTIEGSSSRGGVNAARTLVDTLAGGVCIGITPDGPRGPRMRAQIGAIRVAQLSGAPLFPVTFGARRRRMLSSWDRFVVVYPFSRGVLIYGDPIHVARDADADALEQSRALLERRLNEITAEADRLTGHAAVEPAALRERLV